MVAPVHQVGRVADPDVSRLLKWAYGAVDQRPPASYPRWEQRRVFIIRRHDAPQPLKLDEIFGHSDLHVRAGVREPGVRNRITLKLIQERDPGVFDPPALIRARAFIRHQSWRWVNLPVADAVLAPCGRKVRDSAPVFDPAQKERRSIRKARR